jgi:hypothetical protein
VVVQTSLSSCLTALAGTLEGSVTVQTHHLKHEQEHASIDGSGTDTSGIKACIPPLNLHTDFPGWNGLLAPIDEHGAASPALSVSQPKAAIKCGSVADAVRGVAFAAAHGLKVYARGEGRRLM